MKIFHVVDPVKEFPIFEIKCKASIESQAKAYFMMAIDEFGLASSGYEEYSLIQDRLEVTEVSE